MGDATKNNSKDKAKKPGFFKGLKKEFKKVVWPNRKDTGKQTAAVLIISLVVGALIALMDTVIQYGVDFLTTF